MFSLLQELIRSVVKVIISFAAGGGVGLLAVGVLATMDPDRWDFSYIDHHGPPFGPTLLAVGAGLLTSAATMCALFFPTWWRSFRQPQYIVMDEPPMVRRP
jgi:hypothetical protein